MQTNDVPQAIHRISEVERLTGLRAPTIYGMVREKRFPRPLKLGPRASGWLASDIATWQRQRIAERDGEAA